MKRFIRSDESSDFIREHQNKPEGGYLYIFKHGIGPGTLPKDVEVIKTKDLPNGYTAVWTDRFLTTKEMDQYDIPYETEINRYLERIGYCQKPGDVVPCEDITASTDPTTKYADKVTFEDIYPSDHDICFYFTSNDAAYAEELFGNIDGISGFTIEVSLPKVYSGDWEEALISISPKVKDAEGGESDTDWTDITREISNADMKSLVEQSWSEYKNWERGGDNPDSEITSASHIPSRKSKNITKEVLDYTSDKYPALHQELVDKDIWIYMWSDGEYSLNYNGLKSDYFVSEAVKDDLVKAVEELYPGSFWGDLTGKDDVEASTKYGADMCNITGASNSLVYKNYGDVNFADTGNLVAEDPNRPGCYYVILCYPVPDSEPAEWVICEEYVDTSDTWFDLDEVAKWAGDSVREDPAELAVCIIDYYGPQSTQGWKKYSSKEAEEFLNNLNVEGKIYWDASI